MFGTRIIKSGPGALLCALAVLSLVTPAMADGRFPGHELTRSDIKSKEKADKLFEAGNYGRAFFIYENDLAPIGDKYAQYMVGYMYLSGKGVPEDAVRASAWYRLAAERGHRSFSEASVALYASLNEEQRSVSDETYRQLRQEFGDIWIVRRMLEADIETLANRESPLSVADPANGYSVTDAGSHPSLYQQVAERLETRIRFLESLLIKDASITPADRSNFQALLRRANDEVQAYKGD